MQVQANAALAKVPVYEGEAERTSFVFDQRRDVPGLVATRRLDLDDVRGEVHQLAARIRTALIPYFDYADATKICHLS
jgi:hypothetical protein